MPLGLRPTSITIYNQWYHTDLSHECHPRREHRANSGDMILKDKLLSTGQAVNLVTRVTATRLKRPPTSLHSHRTPLTATQARLMSLLPTTHHRIQSLGTL